MKKNASRHAPLILQRSDTQRNRARAMMWISLLYIPLLAAPFIIFYDELGAFTGIILISLLPVLLLMLVTITMLTYAYLAAKNGRLHIDEQGMRHTTLLPLWLQKWMPKQGVMAHRFPQDWTAHWDDITMMRLAPSIQFKQNPGPAQALLEVFTGPARYELYPYQWVDPKVKAPQDSLDRTFFLKKPEPKALEKALLFCPVLKHLAERKIKVHVDHGVYEFGGQTQRVGLIILFVFFFIISVISIPSFTSWKHLFDGLESTVTATKAAENHALPTELRTVLGHNANVIPAAFNADNTILASGGAADEEIRLWTVETGKRLATLSAHENNLEALAFNTAGTLLASASEDDTVRIWSMESHEVLQTLTSYSLAPLGHAGFYTVAFSPDDTLLAAGNWNGSFTVWRTEDWSALYTIEPSPKKMFGWLPAEGDGHSDSIDAIAFSPDGKLLTTGSFDKTIKIWAVQTGQLLRTLTGHEDWVYAVTFSPDGTYILSGGDDLALLLWEVDTGNILQIMKGHTRTILSTNFSPDGKVLVSSGQDKTIRFWERSTGVLLKTLKAHRDAINTTVLSSDGKLLASASGDNSLKLWEIATE
ncbi:MAG: WD40 repeat domain-containing protein [Pseudomonadota bacterium]